MVLLQGASQLPGCEGEGGPVSFGVWWWCRRRLFLFGGGAGASQLPGCEGEGGPVSFGVVFVVCFCFETSRRASQLPGL